jgi:hypothetical protein
VGERIETIARQEHVSVGPRYLLPGETFGECRWCEFEPVGAACLQWFWRQGPRLEMETSCLMCAHDVIEVADQHVERECIKVEYPIFAPMAVAAA